MGASHFFWEYREFTYDALMEWTTRLSLEGISAIFTPDRVLFDSFEHCKRAVTLAAEV